MNQPEIIPAFSQPIYVNTVELDDYLISEVVNSPTNDDSFHHDPTYRNNGSMSVDRQWLQSHPEIRNIVEEHLDNYVFNELGIGRQRHQLIHTCSWVNMHKNGDVAQGHTHTNSMFSGVMYFKIPENSGELRFHCPAIIPTYVTQTVLPDIVRSNVYNMREINIMPEVGMIIIFPSHLAHSVSVNESNEQRYSMAFNYFMKGQFGYDDNSLTI